MKLKDYQKILLFKLEIDISDEWQMVKSYHLYGGASEEDIDYITTYFNPKLNKEIQFMINYYTKNAYARLIPIKKDIKKKVKYI